MTDPELRARLDALRPPASSAPAQNRALHRAILALDASGRDHAATPPPRSAPRPAAPAPRFALPALLGALAVLTLGFWLLRPAPPGDTPPANAPDDRQAALRMLAEVQATFPGRLNAVIERDGTLQIDLTDNADHPPSDQAIVVELTRAGQVVRILGYSGRALDVEIGGRPVRFAPLITGGGEVLLEGDSFAWNPGLPVPSPLAGWSIEARPL